MENDQNDFKLTFKVFYEIPVVVLVASITEVPANLVLERKPTLGGSTEGCVIFP